LRLFFGAQAWAKTELSPLNFQFLSLTHESRAVAGFGELSPLNFQFLSTLNFQFLSALTPYISVVNLCKKSCSWWALPVDNFTEKPYGKKGD
jgi:hypothetical protein